MGEAKRRAASGWRSAPAPTGNGAKLSYGEAKRTVDGLTQGLLDLKLEPGSPVAILSGNSIEHALMTQAAMQARLPAAPVSPAYSLMSQDHLKLKYLFDLIKPKVVMVQDGPAFEKALKALDLDGVTVIHVARPCEGIESIAFADLAATPVTERCRGTRSQQITPDTVGKLLFTSGSTGMPKAVINTQQMMCANAAMMMQVRPRDPNGPIATMLDWMPWNHTMGGNARFIRCWSTAARSTSTTAGRCRACSTRRCVTCARSRRPITPTCRPATPRSRRRWKRTTRCAAASSEI